MGTPYLGELKLISWNYAPKAWAFANGQLLSLQQNTALFSLLGTVYGGNGQNNFALPNLQGRVAMHFGNGFAQGQSGGQINHTLIQSELPQHFHTMNAINGGQNNANPGGHLFAATTGNATVYGLGSPIPVLPTDISNTGGSQPHENEQPYLVMNWIIALQGIFPSRN